MGISERKERERERRRNEIIDAAEQVFFGKGVETATMDDVAMQAELSKGTLYLYFKTKEDLYLAIHLRGNRVLKEMFEKAVSTDQPGLYKVRAIGQAYCEYYKQYPDYFNAMIYYESREVIPDPEDSVAMECAMLGRETLELVSSAVAEGIRDGSIRSDIDPVKTAISLWGQSTGIIQIMATKGALIQMNFGLTDEILINYTYDLIYHALRAGDFPKQE